MGGFFKKPKKAMKAFFKDPIRIVGHDLGKLDKRIEKFVMGEHKPLPKIFHGPSGEVKAGPTIKGGKIDGGQISIKISI